jgi:hypothetical protein
MAANKMNEAMRKTEGQLLELYSVIAGTHPEAAATLLWIVSKTRQELGR